MKRGCIAIGDTSCSECGQTISYGERYLVLDRDDKSISRLCIRCCEMKRLAGYCRDGGSRVMTFLAWAEPYEPYIHLPPLKPRPYRPHDEANDFEGQLAYTEPRVGKHLLQQKYDILLRWCSAKGTGYLEHFHVACCVLGVASQESSAWPMLRTLTLLGHTESVWTSNGCCWGIAPAAIVQIAAGDGRYFLAGQRIPALLKKLPSDWHVCDESSNGGPTRKTLKGNFVERDMKLTGGYEICNTCCVSMQLAEIAPDLLGWKNGLKSDPDIRSHLYGFERYGHNAFTPVQTNDLVPGFYRLTRMEGSNKREVCRFYDADGRWLQGEFYGLRYLDAQLKGKCKILWNNKGYLDMAEEQRWPFLYERALVLASGELPRKMKGKSGKVYLRYSGINADLARLLCQKLNVELVEKSNV